MVYRNLKPCKMISWLLSVVGLVNLKAVQNDLIAQM